MKNTLSIALLLLLMTSPQCWSRPKTDVVTLHNGDRVTCEIKSLFAGLLECSTDAMGTLKIEREDIAHIQSSYQFQVRYSDHSRYLGRIGAIGESRQFSVVGTEGTRDSEWLQVVELRPQQTTFKDALDVYLSAGYDYTKASETAQFTLGLDMSYEQEKSRSALQLRHNVSDTRAESTSSTRLDVFRGYFTEKKRKLFYYGNSSYESNDQLELDYRVSLAGGYGRYFVDNHERQFVAAVGLQANTERDTADDQQESLEGALKTQFSTWRFDAPNLDLKFTLNLYPSLTESGRLRGDSDLRLRWELYRDLFWDLTWWGAYDNRNIGGDDFDYGVSTGIGWDY